MSLLSTEEKQLLFQCFSVRQEQMIEGIRQNMRVPSAKGPAREGAPFGIGPRDALLDALSQAEALGLRTCNLDNQIGYAEYGDGEEMVAILGHLDVVPADGEWTFPPYDAVYRDGILYGRGALDDKGPTIGALYALRAIADSGISLKRRIRVIMGTNEESGSACVRHYLAQGQDLPAAGFTPDAEFPAIFCEKGRLLIDLACPVTFNGAGVSLNGGIAPNVVMPSLSISLREEACFAGTFPGLTIRREQGISHYHFAGKSAHASTPHLGRNAAYLAAEFWKARELPEDVGHLFHFIRDWLHQETDGTTLGISFRDGETGDLTVNLGRIYCQGGSYHMLLDIRYPPRCSVPQILEKITAAAPACGLSVFGHTDTAPLYLPKDAPLLQTLTRVYQEHTGRDVSPIAIGGGTYAKSFANMVAFGPVFPGQEDVIHQPNERVAIMSLITGLRMDLQAIVELARQAEL